MKPETAYPSYPAYKDSGIEWLGNVPEHWANKRLRFVAIINPSKSEVSFLDRDSLISFLPMEAIGDDGTIIIDREKTISEVETGYTYFREGDVTIAKITPCFENGKGAVMKNLRNGIGFGTTELIVVRPYVTQSSSQYLHWLFISSPFRKLGEAHMYGAGGQKRVPDDFVRNFIIAFPPLPEQKSILAFLDRETARIDTLIEKQKRLITLLTEKRQAVISHAVTKGLDPNAPMKDSGVVWIGESPSAWKVLPLRFVAKLESGHTPSRSHPEWWVNCTIPWFTLGDVWQLREGRDYVYETSEYVSELGLANSSARLLPKGTVILSRTASVGFVGILGRDMATTQDFANWVCSDLLDPRFLLHTFRSMQPEFERLKYGSTHSTIYMPDINAFRVALPPIPEQQAIVAFLDCETAKIDKLIEKANQSIQRMRERRSALISAAVTGKIDVREAV